MMFDGKESRETMDRLEESKRKLDQWSKEQGIVLEDRKCQYCGNTFRVSKNSKQMHHSATCKYINGPKDHTWGGTERIYSKAGMSSKRPLKTHDEFGHLI